jgi:peptidoglycan biosynthesis protein MviN/MurJ (putative lipid II flippase)
MSEEAIRTGEIHHHVHIHLDQEVIALLEQLFRMTYNQSISKLSPVQNTQVAPSMDPTAVMNLVEKFMTMITRDKEDLKEDRYRYR